MIYDLSLKIYFIEMANETGESKIRLKPVVEFKLRILTLNQLLGVSGSQG